MDANLLAGLKARESRAQRECRARFLPGLVAVCQRALKNEALARETAEDVLADVLLKHVDQLRTEEALPAYLRMIALRRCGRLSSFSARHEELDDGHLDPVEGPEAQYARAEERHVHQKRLEHCMGLLQPKIRSVLRMRFHDDATQEAIGNLLGVSKQYVGKVISKALESLKVCMEAQA